jgi:hypothetical protein
MGQIAVVCVVGVLCGALAAGCGERKPEKVGLEAVYDGDPNVSIDMVNACFSADDDARRALLDPAIDPTVSHDRLIKMIAVCRPIMSALNVNSPNPKVAETARICKQAFETKFQAYQKRADGDLSTGAVELMFQMLTQHGECIDAVAKLEGTYQPPPPDPYAASDNSMN